MSGIILEQPYTFSRTDITEDADTESRVHKIIISDETVDSFRTVFKAASWDLSYRNMGKKKVTYGHPSASNLDPNLIIGKGEERLVGMQLYSTLTIEPSHVRNPIADTVHEKLIFGSLTDASIRARVEDGRMGDESLGEDPTIFYFTRSILYDYGIVPDGSNPNAMKQRSDLADFIKTKVPQKFQREIQFLKALETRYYIM